MVNNFVPNKLLSGVLRVPVTSLLNPYGKSGTTLAPEPVGRVIVGKDEYPFPVFAGYTATITPLLLVTICKLAAREGEPPVVVV